MSLKLFRPFSLQLLTSGKLNKNVPLSLSLSLIAIFFPFQNLSTRSNLCFTHYNIMQRFYFLAHHKINMSLYKYVNMHIGILFSYLSSHFCRVRIAQFLNRTQFQLSTNKYSFCIWFLINLRGAGFLKGPRASRITIN